MIITHRFHELPSTNDYLKANYATYPEDCAIVAEIQTSGRGRFDRVWLSEEDLTFSLLMHQVRTYAVLAPLAVVNTLKQFGYETQIKWPNDILYQGKKCCGILIEDIFTGNEYTCSIIGIGINVHEKVSEDYQYAHIDIAKEELYVAFLKQWDILLKQSFHDCMKQYRMYSYLLHKTIRINHEVYVVEDVSEDGYLIVRNNQETRILKSEEITLKDIYREG